MKQYSIIILLSLLALSARSQNGIGRVLQSVEQNNKELKANNQFTVAQKLDARTGNSLPDPSVQYEYMFGSPEELGKTGELTVSQSFDFPTVYANKAKIARLKASSYDKQHAQFRQELLLQVKELCLDLIALNQQKELLEKREANARNLHNSYANRLQTGDATILEVNKVELELLNVKTEARMNEANRIAKLRELTALNGDVPIEFTDTAYEPTEPLPSFDELKAAILASSLQLHSLESEQEIAQKNISLNKSLWLPKFELGYRRNTGKGEQFNGFLAGISIPLWENRNKVKQAKAQSLYTRMQYESASLQTVSSIQGMYDQLKALDVSMKEYNNVLNPQENISLLDKALVAGQISTIDYFVEITTINQSLQNYIQLENQYQKLLAQLYKFKL